MLISASRGSQALGMLLLISVVGWNGGDRAGWG